MITLYTSFQSKVFSSQVPDVSFAISHADGRAKVTVTIAKSGDSQEVYCEALYPDTQRRISLTDLDLLLQPYTAKWLQYSLTVTIKEQTVSTNSAGNEVITQHDERTLTTTVISCRARILYTTAENWCNSHFLTLLDGPKMTAPGFKEYLYYIGSGTVYCNAYYDDGMMLRQSVTVNTAAEGLMRIDASPNSFVSSGHKLMRYTIFAGNRSQEFLIDHDIEPEVAPVLLFWNSFGVQELAYCTGELKLVASFDRKQGRIGRKKTTYSLDEKKTFKADTGYMTYPMASWWNEVLRSESVQMVPVVNGSVDLSNTREVVITSEKSEISNAPDAMPRFTFEFEYADRNHNIYDIRTEGRIFDDTFDYTFN